MKIYFLAYNIYGMGGTVRTVVNTANYLARNRYSVEIISIRRTSQSPLFNLDRRVKLTPLIDVRNGKLFSNKSSFFKKIVKKVLMKLPSVLIDRSEDLYKMFNIFTDIKILLKLREIKKGVLITTFPSLNIISARFVRKEVYKIGQEHKYYNAHQKRLQNKLKKYYPKLDGLTCLTEYDRDSYRQLLSDRKVIVQKIENGTDIPFESAQLDNKEIIAAGRYSKEKGFDLLIEAFASVIKKHPEWKLKIFGSGPEEPYLRELILRHEAYNNIYLMPTTNEILKKMLNSSMYVVSSRSESFGMVILEAMSVGVPCVSFACVGPREIIRDKENGILVEEGDVEGLSAGIIELIENEFVRKQYGQNAKTDVQEYSLNRIGGKWERFLEDIVSIED